MKTVIIEYARISPSVLANRISNAFHCLTNWKDIDEDYFEFSVYGCTELAELEDVLAEYVQYLAFSILMPQARAHGPCARCLLYHKATHFVKQKIQKKCTNLFS